MSNVSVKVVPVSSSEELKQYLTSHRLKKIVFLRLVFTKIGDIDTVKECFEATAYIEALWREPSLDGKVDTFKSCSEEFELWNPDIYVDNSIGELSHRTSRDVELVNDSEVYLLERHTLKGKFFERMELKDFPFDTQDITITVASKLSAAEIDFEEMKERPSRVLHTTFTDEQEWALHCHVEAEKATVISDSQMGPRKRPVMHFSTRAGRRSGYFIINIWLVSFVLCILAICVFGISHSNLQGRLQLSFLLMLTTVTFKFVITNSIPRISYLTILDKAVLLNFIFLVLLAVWHTIAHQFAVGNHPLDTNEKWVIIAFCGLYIIGLFILIIEIFMGGRKRRTLMLSKDRAYENKWKEYLRTRGDW